MTITIFYSTGTILVQGNKCPRWRDEEFSSLILCIRAIYTFVDRVKEPGLHETVTWNLCSLRLPTVSPWPAGEPRLHDVRPRCSPRPLLPRTTGNTRSSRRLQALSPKSASPSAAPVPVSQPNILTRQLVPSRTTPPTTPLQQAYPQSHRHLTLPASLPSHTTTTTPRLTIVTELETAKQDIKTELELHVHQLTDTVTSLTQKLTALNNTNKKQTNKQKSRAKISNPK